MKKVAIIIPCFNEEEGIPALQDALLPLQRELQQQYELQWIFVDDGSTDKTFPLLQGLAKNLSSARVQRHEKNKNLGAALRTGLEASAAPDFVAYLDSDCTYDPRILLKLLPMLESGAMLVTASPYHPEGDVVGVPPWRLLLSKGLSLIYRLLTRSTLHTFTAMVRVQRFESVIKTNSDRDDFTYITEVLLNHLRLGLRVEELPATLSTRRFGFSKMKTMRTIFLHLELIKSYLLSGGVTR